MLNVLVAEWSGRKEGSGGGGGSGGGDRGVVGGVQDHLTPALTYYTSSLSLSFSSSLPHPIRLPVCFLLPSSSRAGVWEVVLLALGMVQGDGTGDGGGDEDGLPGGLVGRDE